MLKLFAGSTRTGFCALAALAATALCPAMAANIGTTIVVVKSVTGTTSDISRQLVINDNVATEEIIATAPDAATAIQFVDGTKLELGPNAKVVLDKFVYDPAPGKGALALTVSEGVMRFTTGSMAKENYTINTPNGTLGVRGTDFNLLVGNGGTIVQVIDGEVFGTSKDGKKSSYTKDHCFAMHLSTGICSGDEFNFINQQSNLMIAILVNPTGGNNGPPNNPNPNSILPPASPH
jgi:ferric-dicitrate binding protein FerR (iron transport regulator)